MLRFHPFAPSDLSDVVAFVEAFQEYDAPKCRSSCRASRSVPAEAEMLRRGCRRIRIRAKATNPAAWKCYEAAGCRPYEVDFRKSIG